MSSDATGSLPIDVRACGRRFGARVALDGVDFALEPGTIAGLVGPNGSGKTTLLKILAGFLRPTSGEVRVLGRDPFRERAAVMRGARFAFAPPALFEALTAREHLAHLCRLSGARARRAELDEALDLVGLTGRDDELVRGFSFGMRQRLALAQALLPEPQLLVLDEPTDGLDPIAVLELREILRRLRDERGVAVLLSSHLMVEVDELVDDMLVLREGSVLFRGAPEELRRSGERLLLRVSDSAAGASALRARGYEPIEAERTLELPPGALALREAADLLSAAGVELEAFHRERPTLEAALLARLRERKG